ncbi:putative methyltransferase DDB_G0268948 isoform X3 [Daphnia magna]|uniref:putative methyltransferase DDB_G0268948 isoform X3 n=1 Tax=Daphnia magna TaxID=35525 RepID=UPI001401E960|nr:putative methyltransferase DDB_G0268948 isoform X3 [Daphnia magna]
MYSIFYTSSILLQSPTAAFTKKRMAKEWSQRGYESTVIASRYVDFRPKPPQQLTERIVEFLKEKYPGDLSLCLDVGCGSGQCSVLLSPHFEKVLATDISCSQIDVAKSQNLPSNIEFRVCPAEQSPVEDGSVQIVNAGVCAHWFDLPMFFKEVDRVLCSNGVVALFSYGPPVVFLHPTKSEELFAALKFFYSDRLGPYWASGVKHTENEYADINLPYPDFVREEVWKEENLTLAGFVEYLTSWCSYNNYCKANGDSAGHEILQEFTSNVQKALETTHDPQEIELHFKRKYFLLMAHKP